MGEFKDSNWIICLKLVIIGLKRERTRYTLSSSPFKTVAKLLVKKVDHNPAKGYDGLFFLVFSIDFQNQ